MSQWSQGTLVLGLNGLKPAYFRVRVKADSGEEAAEAIRKEVEHYPDEIILNPEDPIREDGPC